MKAHDSAVYAAAMFFLSLASLYSPKWSLGHIQIRCIPRDSRNEQQVLKKQFLAAMSRDTDAQILYLDLEARFEAEEKNEVSFYQDGSNFVKILYTRYKKDFENPQNYKQVLQGLKKVLAGVHFIRDVDVVDLCADIQEFVESDLKEFRKGVELQKDEARKMAQRSSEEIREQREE